MSIHHLLPPSPSTRPPPPLIHPAQPNPTKLCRSGVLPTAHQSGIGLALKEERAATVYWLVWHGNGASLTPRVLYLVASLGADTWRLFWCEEWRAVFFFSVVVRRKEALSYCTL